MYHIRVEVLRTNRRPMEIKKKGKKKTKNEKKEEGEIFVDSIQFFSGNPSVEITQGLVHLYIHKEDQLPKPTDEKINLMPVICFFILFLHLDFMHIYFSIQFVHFGKYFLEFDSIYFSFIS